MATSTQAATSTPTATPIPVVNTPTETEAPTATAAATQEISQTETPTQAPTESASPTPENTPEASPVATSAPTETSSGASTSACTDLAAFYADVTIPDDTMFNQGEQFVKTWQIRNLGTCSWGSGYQLVFQDGSAMNGPMQSALPAANPGDIVDVSVDLTAPSRGGTYRGNWAFQNPQGHVFGVGVISAPIWVQIKVAFFTGNQPAPTTTPATTGQTTTVQTAGCSTSRDTTFESSLIDIINQARVAQGLSALQPQDQLTNAALSHSIDMACNGYVDHVGSDGSLWYDRIAAQGYANYNSGRENIRVGFPDYGFTPQYVFDQWNISQVHHDNMFDPNVSQIGVGYVFSPDSKWGGYVTADFARP